MLGTRTVLALATASALGFNPSSCTSLFSPLGATSPLGVTLDSNWGADHNTVGQTITFVATATGGTLPYTYFWSLDGAAWTTADAALTVNLVNPGYHTIDVVVRDSAASETDPVGIGNIYVEPADGGTTTGGTTDGGSTSGGTDTSTDPGGSTTNDCPSPTGAYSTNWDDMKLWVSGGNNGGTSPVQGSYEYRHGVIAGTFDWSTYKMTGTWTEYYDDGSFARDGTFEWTFTADFKSFQGTWQYSDSTHLNGGWSGSRSDCSAPTGS